VGIAERGAAGAVGILNRSAVRAQVRERAIPIDGVLQDAAVHDQAERAQLVFLLFAVALPHLAARAVKDHPREALAPLPAIELGQAAPSVRRVADGVEQDD